MSSSPTSPNRPVYSALDLVLTTQTLNFNHLTFRCAEDDPDYPGGHFYPSVDPFGPSRLCVDPILLTGKCRKLIRVKPSWVGIVPNPPRGRGARTFGPPRRSAAGAEALFEELLELGVEDGVDDGVEGAVDVAQPGDGAHQAGRDVAGQAQGSRGVDHEERRPAEQEAAWENRIEGASHTCSPRKGFTKLTNQQSQSQRYTLILSPSSRRHRRRGRNIPPRRPISQPAQGQKDSDHS